MRHLACYEEQDFNFRNALRMRIYLALKYIPLCVATSVVHYV